MLISYYPLETKISEESKPTNFLRAQKILELVKQNKYFKSALLLYSKLLYMLQDKSSTVEILNEILASDQSNIDAYTLMIHIMIDNNDMNRAKEIINEGLINNPQKAKKNFAFNFAKAKAEFASESFEPALKSVDELLIEEAKTVDTEELIS